jgi:hypothetical protein
MGGFTVHVSDRDAAPQPAGQIWGRQCLQLARDASWYTLVYKEVLRRIDGTVWWVGKRGAGDVESAMVVVDECRDRLRLQFFGDRECDLAGSGYRLIARAVPPGIIRALTPGSVSDLSGGDQPCLAASPQEPAK